MKRYIPYALLSLGFLIIVALGVNAIFFETTDVVKKATGQVEQQERNDQGCMFLPEGEKIAFDTTDYGQYQDNNRKYEIIYPEDGEVAEIIYNIFDPGKTSVCVQHTGGRSFYLVKDAPQSNGKYVVYFDGKYAGTRLLQGKNKIDVLQDVQSEKFGALRRNILHTTVMVMGGNRPFEEKAAEEGYEAEDDDDYNHY